MILKLVKHDIRKMTLNLLVYVYVISLALAGITRIIKIWDDIYVVFIISQVFAGLTYSAIGSILVNTFVQVLRVFHTTFYKDESYLTHTLPVKKSELLNAKYISTILVILASVLVSFLSLFIIFYSKEFVLVLKQLIEVTILNFNMSVGLFITLLVLIIFSQICAMISMSFTAVIKGCSYNRKRVIRGFGWFGLFYLGSLLTTLIVAVIVFAIGGMLPELTAEVLSQTAFLTLLIMALILYLIYAVVFYFISLKEFKKGVNVD